jgi:hypothetical protein
MMFLNQNIFQTPPFGAQIRMPPNRPSGPQLLRFSQFLKPIPSIKSRRARFPFGVFLGVLAGLTFMTLL